MADNLNQRLEATIQDLQEKHRTGRNEIDHPDRAPTGLTYQAIHAQQQHLYRTVPKQQQKEPSGVGINQPQQPAGEEDDGDDGDEFDDLLDDPALDELRDRRLEQMKQQHNRKLEQLAQGHGQYRTISQDEFLPECNTHNDDDNDDSTNGRGSHVVVHFAHEEFERCKIMDHHLKELAQQYLECKFVRILAEKAPFFVQKLHIRTLPTLLVFCKGKVVDRLTGFEGLVPTETQNNNAGSSNCNQQKQNSTIIDEWETWRLAKWLADHTDAIQYKGPKGHEREAWLQQQQKQRATSCHPNKGTLYGGMHQYMDGEDMA